MYTRIPGVPCGWRTGSTQPHLKVAVRCAGAESKPHPVIATAVQSLPTVDWRRYHLQVLFIDNTDIVRARVAAGLFESIAEWNGYGRAMCPWTAGIAARDGSTTPLSTQASLIKQAYSLGLAPRIFTRAAEQFEAEDLDRYDVLVAMDPAVYARVEQHMAQYALPGDEAYYSCKLALLTDFAAYPGDAILQRGGNALLPSKIARVLVPELASILGIKHIRSPDLTSEAGLDEWNSMCLLLMLACAGLVKYLIDVYPDDLPEYDPL
jgi:protein-tyrosine-phosphatase